MEFGLAKVKAVKGAPVGNSGTDPEVNALPFNGSLVEVIDGNPDSPPNWVNSAVGSHCPGEIMEGTLPGSDPPSGTVI